VVWYSVGFFHTLIGGFMGAAIAHAGALSKHGHSGDQLIQK
jgi:hypothetical protein